MRAASSSSRRARNRAATTCRITSSIWPTASARPSLVVCLDSGCGNYDQLWMTTSLRGIAAGTLTVEVLTEGVHSGDASGVVPSSFRILRQLLSRLEDESNGAMRPCRALRPGPGRSASTQARVAAAALGEAVYTEYPVRAGGPADGRRPRPNWC